MTSKEAPTLTGAEAVHNDALAAALTAIDTLVQQEIGEGEYNEDDLMPLVNARVALANWAEQEAAEYTDDNNGGNSVISATARTSLTRKGFDLTRKVVTGTTKAVDESQGIVEAIVNVTGTVDLQRDLMEVGSWDYVIKQMRAGEVPWPSIVWGHDWAVPVGKVLDAEELRPGDSRLKSLKAAPGAGGLRIRGRYNLETSRGKDAFSDVKFGAIPQWSVGFLTEPEGEHLDYKGIRHVTKVGQWPEVSNVLVGASPGTYTVAAKSAATATLSDEEFDELLRQLENEFHEALTDSVLRDAEPLDPEFKAVIKRFVHAELERCEQPAAADNPGYFPSQYGPNPRDAAIR